MEVKEKKLKKHMKELLSIGGQSADEKTKLLLFNRYLDAGHTSPADEWIHAQFISFFRLYLLEISRWLGQPQTIIKQKIEEKTFTEIELSLIITNVLIENAQVKEAEEENN